MCGIAGFHDPALAESPARSVLGEMAATVRHRGPDGQGVWFDARLRVGLAHRRLSILDLSPAGAQPMVSGSGRFVIVFNGEIYNHRRLRADLIAHNGAMPFRGHSDTEVLLAAFEAWGIEATLGRANGMFAMAVLDTRLGKLHLMRDRVGEKPLYYARLGPGLIFASELKALHLHRGWQPRLDHAALHDFFRHGYVPAPRSIFAGVRKVLPGEWLTLDLSRPGSADLQARRFWSAADTVRQGLHTPLQLDDAAALRQVETLLLDAVALRMEADVPLGAFLSGGIDSSLVVALMQRQAAAPVRTFSIGFADARFDEAPAARAVARHLGTDHTELYVSPRRSLEVIPRLPGLYDEPFADASQIPTFLVAQLARQHVTVALSGDGGDELFCGYGRYEAAVHAWRGFRSVPEWARRAVANMITAVPVPALNALGVLLPRRITAGRAGDRAHKAAERLSMRSFDELYRSLMSHWRDPADALHREIRCAPRSAPTPLAAGVGPAYERMMACDLSLYLPDDVLVKVDRASMAVSLEGRMPLLDHRVVELAWQLPLRMKRRDGVGKWLLRELLYRHVPRALVDRRKQGFGVPIGSWLRRELRGWATDLLGRETLMRDGLLDTQRLHRMLHEHLTGQRSWTNQLWTALMFQAWRGAQRAAYPLHDGSIHAKPAAV